MGVFTGSNGDSTLVNGFPFESEPENPIESIFSSVFLP
jgi:hypothetical protein